jgi:hypothetical protein
MIIVFLGQFAEDFFIVPLQYFFNQLAGIFFGKYEFCIELGYTLYGRCSSLNFSLHRQAGSIMLNKLCMYIFLQERSDTVNIKFAN